MNLINGKGKDDAGKKLWKERNLQIREFLTWRILLCWIRALYVLSGFIYTCYGSDCSRTLVAPRSHSQGDFHTLLICSGEFIFCSADTFDISLDFGLFALFLS